MRAPVRPTTRQGQQGTLKVTDHLNPAHEEVVAGEDGLSHDGDPEVEVIEEGDSEEDEVVHARPKVLKAPRAPHPEGDRRAYGHPLAPCSVV